jgi:hypothetical protein
MNGHELGDGQGWFNGLKARVQHWWRPGPFGPNRLDLLVWEVLRLVCRVCGHREVEKLHCVICDRCRTVLWYRDSQLRLSVRREPRQD